MDIKKLAPWNWFKKEQEDAGKSVPVNNPAVNETLWEVTTLWFRSIGNLTGFSTPCCMDLACRP